MCVFDSEREKTGEGESMGNKVEIENGKSGIIWSDERIQG